MSRRRGLSLIEVVVAIIVLGLAIPPLVIQMSAGIAGQEAVLVQQHLTRLASERMWQVFADHADPTRGYAHIADEAYPLEDKPNGLNGYSRRTEVVEVSPTDCLTPQVGSGIKRLRIEVSGPGDHSLVIESLLANVSGST